MFRLGRNSPIARQLFQCVETLMRVTKAETDARSLELYIDIVASLRRLIAIHMPTPMPWQQH